MDGNNAGNDFLAELYGKVIANVQKETISSRFKNMDLSGNPEAGSVEAKRFANATSQNYGTARTAGAGGKVTAKPVVVPIDTDKEIVEEMEDKDVALYGVEGVLTRRSNNHVQSMARELDKAFFTAAKTAGTSLTLTASTIQDQFEEAIQACETVENDFVDGVPRSMINIVCTPAIYGQIRSYLDTIPAHNVDAGDEEFHVYHGVKVFSSIHLPASTGFIVLVDGAVAQPVRSSQYSAERIPLSNAIYGTKVVMPDLIFYANP